MHPKPTLAGLDYPTRHGAIVDALDRRLKGNVLINGAFQVWQRGTSFSAGAAQYSADRWQFVRGGAVAGATASRQTGVTAEYCMRMQRTAADASVATIGIYTSIESTDSIPLAGKQITVKLLGRAGANFSAENGALVAVLVVGTGTDQNVITGFTGADSSRFGVALLTPGGAQAVLEFTGAALPTNARQVGLQVYYTPVGTAGANDWVEIEEVQLVVGEYAGNFPYRAYADELAICQRYYERLSYDFTNLVVAIARAFQPTDAAAVIPFRVQKRSAPTFSSSNVAQFLVQGPAGNIATTNLAASNINRDSCSVVATVASGLTSGDAVQITNTNAGSFIAFSSEL